ncbi:PRMT5-domain-containing protein [Violaceomyces palustris]|uniref:PRMT5-domain-containing protein n=1 Tax=Violaceomyces palustris TaxID=1673888 RepID=A0ACD0P2P2_9BASI|nr:PRMT5-domain-containing protein [Violaceomyces palustris]
MPPSPIPPNSPLPQFDQLSAAGQSEHNGRPPLPVALHVPTSAISYVQPSQAQQSSSNPNHPNPNRRGGSPLPPLGGLPTLPEASHANALHAATGPSPAALGLNPTELDAVTTNALQGLTPVQRTLHLSRSQGYDSLVIELANQRWKERWERLCLANPGTVNEVGYGSPTNGHMASSTNTTSLSPKPWDQTVNPAGMGGSWEVLNGSGPAALNGGGLARSSSRQGIASSLQSKYSPSVGAGTPYPRADLGIGMDVAREAEEWRRSPSFRRGEVNVTKLEETEGVILMASPWIELDSLDEGVRLDSEIALHQEVAYASYLGVSNIVIPAPSSEPSRRAHLADYARAINSCINGGGAATAPAGQWMNLLIRLPISSPYNLSRILARQAQRGSTIPSSSTTGTSASNHSASLALANPATAAAFLRADDEWAWETWESIRQICNYSTRIQVALDLSYPLPSPSTLSRWTAEPVSMLWLPSVAYLANAKGFPVLSKAAQAFIKGILKKTPTIALSGAQNPPPNHTRGGPSAYLQYIRHLEKSSPPDSVVDSFARGYTDWLQAPLQPLMDNLESTTYEVFERDPVKYAVYEEAVFRALLDKPPTSTTNIWVCGAGRGPLVTRCLNAAQRAGRTVRMTAVEKNPNALVTLQEKQALEWGDSVTIRYGDMRTLPVPSSHAERPDIVVSELLGSFGDNELSPECLDGAMRFLKPDGFSIPASYSSYLAPLSSAKLHSEVMSGTASSSEKALQKSSETPYVVLFQSVNLLSAQGGRHNWEKIQESWSFEHKPASLSGIVLDSNGLPVTNGHNVRTATHSFHIPQSGVCHGLAGYFEANLYGDVSLSIHPDPSRGSKDMLSWFPIFFPFKDPLYLPANSELDVHMWRLSGNNRVWYEWCAESFLPLPADLVYSMAGKTSINSSGDSHSTISTHMGPTPSNDVQVGQSQIYGSTNFMNAPGTPRIPSSSLPSDHVRNRDASGGSSYVGNSNPGGAGGANRSPVVGASGAGSFSPNLTTPGAGGGGITRVKIGMTGLHNPNGRSSWIGL